MEGAFVGWLLITGGVYLGWAAFVNKKPVNTALNWMHYRATGTKGTLEEAGPGMHLDMHPFGTATDASVNLPTSGNGTSGIPTNAAASAAIAFAASQIGKPYSWGGAGPAVYDCSGLTQQSYHAAGISIPRTATDQYQATKSASVSMDTPGALLFYGSPTWCYHCGISTGAGQMIDAPHTGFPVRTEPYATAGQTGGPPFAATYPPALGASGSPVKTVLA